MKHSPAPRVPSVSLAALGPHAGAIVVLMNLMHVRHLLASYRAFDGDLVAAIVLGEVAHHNLSTKIARARTPLELSASIVTSSPDVDKTFQPTNTFSIAQATGIPRETIRRKVAMLTRRGWMVKDASGNLFVSTTAVFDFVEFNAERLDDLLHTARALRSLLTPRQRFVARRRTSAPSDSRPVSQKSPRT